MREIIFKAKRKDNGEWVEGFYFCMVHDDGSHVHHFIMPLGVDLSFGTPIEKIQVEIDANTICQYTGLTDKNGNKIWENDVVVYDNSPYNVYCTPKTGKIAFRNGCLCFKYWLYGSINYMPFSADLFFDRKCEVIGNIFDNPELIGGIA